jgi:hypothetical protein
MLSTLFEDAEKEEVIRLRLNHDILITHYGEWEVVN